MTEDEIAGMYFKWLFIEERFHWQKSVELQIFHAKRNLIKYLYSTWMCVGWEYTKETHQFIKNL